MPLDAFRRQKRNPGDALSLKNAACETPDLSKLSILASLGAFWPPFGRLFATLERVWAPYGQFLGGLWTLSRHRSKVHAFRNFRNGTERQ